MKEVELRGRLVAARNGLEFAVLKLRIEDDADCRRSELFCVHPKRTSEHNDQWLNKAIKTKSWQIDYLERACTVGIFERMKEGSQVLYRLLNPELAEQVVEDFDDYGMLLTKLVVPHAVEVGTDFDDVLAGRAPQLDPEKLNGTVRDSGTDEQVDEEHEFAPDDIVGMKAKDLQLIITALVQLKNAALEVGRHLEEVETNNEERLESIETQLSSLSDTVRKRFNQMDGGLTEVKSLANAAVARMAGISKVLEDGLSLDSFAGFEEKLDGITTALGALLSTERAGKLHSMVMDRIQQTGEAVVGLQRSMGERKTLQKAIDQLQAAKEDSAAAVDLLMSHMDKRGKDAEGS